MMTVNAAWLSFEERRKGTIEVGDALIAGTAYCRIRAMQDENGREVDVAGPSKPVQILGWSATPNAGDDVRQVADDREARHIAQQREAKVRAAAEILTARAPTLEGLMAQALSATALSQERSKTAGGMREPPIWIACSRWRRSSRGRR